MTIDWFTVVAQAINFLVLVWLLKRFLYKPILSAIDARELRIATELADAAAKQSDAEKEQALFLQKNTEFDEHHDTLLKQAAAEASAERKRLVDEARQTADKLRDERTEILNSEFRTLQNDIVRRSRDEVFATTQKILVELSGTSLEARMVELFVGRLHDLDGATKKDLRVSQKAASHPIVIQSAFDLSSGQQAAISTALNETFAAEVPVEFETNVEVIGGVELITDGHKIAWSFSEYLVDLQKNISQILGEEKPGFRSGSSK